MTGHGGRVLGLIGVGLAGALLVACGAPRPGTTVHYDPKQVPYGLLSTEQATTRPSAEADPNGPSVWLVRGNGLVATAATIDTGSPQDQANSVLDQLQQGPSSRQHNEGLSSAVPANLKLQVQYVVSGVANVEYTTGTDSSPPGSEGVLMAGQIVLTLTSVPGVNAVVFAKDGNRVEVPLPGGALTSEPVTEADYQVLVAP